MKEKRKKEEKKGEKKERKGEQENYAVWTENSDH